MNSVNVTLCLFLLVFNVTCIMVQTNFFFVRHGQTDWNAYGSVQGNTDISLNDTGRCEARALKNRVANIDFSACYSSDLKRAYETALILTEDNKIPIIKESNLRERHYGILEGKSLQDLEYATPDELATIEPQSHFFGRILNFLNTISKTSNAENILIVSHGGFMRNMLVHILNLPSDRVTGIRINNTGYIKAYFSGTRWIIEELYGITIPLCLT